MSNELSTQVNPATMLQSAIDKAWTLNSLVA